PHIPLREVSAIRALFLIGQNTGVCFELESVPREDLQRRVTLDLPEQPLSKLVEAILPAGPRRSVREQSGVVHIAGPNMPVKLLRHSMNAFTVETNETIQGISLLLHQALAVELCPGVKSISGRARAGDRNNKVPPFDGSGITIERILNTTLARSTGGLWIAVPPAGRKACELRTRFWTILEYSDPAMETPLQAEAIVDSLELRQRRLRTPTSR
ncbi:MAG: hypothetical protein NTY38_10455, partial [Acidobacteria bacterium]|nr:hypothetical protein [Acidobacteriota bacterium]